MNAPSLSLRDRETADRRLLLLRALSDRPQYTAPETLLRDHLDAHGHAVGRDRLRADLQWLDLQGLIVAQQPGGVWLATLTPRGEDAAQGREAVYGVARPGPG